PEFQQDCRLRVVGEDSHFLPLHPDYRAIEPLCELLPPAPYGQVVEMMAESSVLLIFNLPATTYDDPIPGKFFDYLMFEAPVLAVAGTRGIIGDVLAWTGCGTWAETPAAIADFLRPLYLAWKRDGVVRAPRLAAAVEYFTQRRMTAEYAEVLNAAVETRSPRCAESPPWRAF
ncbi:MAG TPA: hypothetical protein VGM23_12825, partial [Armatimonadota bacterium]